MRTRSRSRDGGRKSARRGLVWSGARGGCCYMGQSDAGAATSCAGHGKTGHCIAGAVSVCCDVPVEAAHGSACEEAHSADSACGGGRSRNCSAAERQLGRWCSDDGRPRRGVPTRDAGAWHQSTSAMNRVRRKPGRLMGTVRLPHTAPAVSVVSAKMREIGGRMAPAARRLSSSATGCAVGVYEGSAFCHHSGCVALARALSCPAWPGRAFAAACSGLVRSARRAGSGKARARLAWCRNAWYSATLRIMARRRFVRMILMVPVWQNLPVRPWPGCATWARNARARCLP